MTTRRLDLAAAAANVKAAASGPLDQKSSVFPELTGFSGLPGWSYFIPQEREQSEMWRGRKRLETVDEMLNHYQVAACWQAVKLPSLSQYVIELAPQQCDLIAVDLIASQLDVPIEGQDEDRSGRRAKAFSARKHFTRAIEAVVYGHAVFEQAGDHDQGDLWKLVDLPPVPQWTLDDASWKVDKHGKLLEVVQYGANPEVHLAADHLVVFTWQGAPGDFRGRSILRPLTAPWMLSDRGMRVTGMAMERTGMGIPVGKVGMAAGSQAKQDMERLLRNLAAGENTNLVLETDEDVQKSMMLMGVTGSTPDLVGILRHWDEAIARGMLASVLQLGSTETGSRALGETFDDLLAMFHDAIVDWYCDTMTAQLVEPWVDRNRGEDTPAPRLVWRRREDEAAQPDAAPDAAPAPDGPAPAAAKRRPLTAAARHDRKAQTTRAAFAQAAGRDLRRDPTPAELAAGTDFSRLEREHVAAREDLAAVLLRERGDLAARAVEIIAAMPTVDPLTLGAVLGPQLAGHAAGMDTAPLVTLLEASAAQGQAQVVAEAASQGVMITPDVDYSARALVEANELQRRMAVQVTEACAAAAKTIVPAAPVQARRGLMSKLRPPARLATIEAGTIGDFLSSLSPAAAEQAAAGATSRATGGGRFGAIASAPTQAVYASEILDEATCPPCSDVDGREYESIEDAMLDYPSLGGFFDCEGGERCRGTAVAVFEGEA